MVSAMDPLVTLIGGTPSSLLYQAFSFADAAHEGQVRKYTYQPYIFHPVDVACIIACTGASDTQLAIALNHDVIEDCDVTFDDVESALGSDVAMGVMALTDQCHEGNRAQRKQAEALRLGATPGYIQTIKIADMISNTSSIVTHDPDFAVTYLKEKEFLLGQLTDADWIMKKLGQYSLNKSKADLESRQLQEALS